MAMKGFKVNYGIEEVLAKIKDDENDTEKLPIFKDIESVPHEVNDFKKNIFSSAIGLSIGAGLDYILDTDEPAFTLISLKIANELLDDKYNNKHKKKEVNDELKNKKTDIKDEETIQKEIEKLCNKSFLDD